MKKGIILSLTAAMAAITALPRPALAWNTTLPAEVFLLNAYQTVPLGKWVMELNSYSDLSGYEACSYFVKWVNASILPMTSNPLPRRARRPRRPRLRLNSVSSVPTAIVASAGFVSVGFDKFNQKRVVQNLMMSETPFGSASGIITFNTNFPYPIMIKNP